MKNIIIYTSIIVVGLIAYSDFETRLIELDKLTKTQSQIELKKDVPKSLVEEKHKF